MGRDQRAIRLNPEKEKHFPRLKSADYEITSQEDPAYNCIAYAANDLTRVWDCPPFPVPGYFWPRGASRGNDLGSLVSAFEAIGFEKCETGVLEDGFEKIVLYENEHGEWEHAAKQLEDGQWSSKLGQLEDIRHASVVDVGGSDYGEPIQFMRRKVGKNPAY